MIVRDIVKMKGSTVVGIAPGGPVAEALNVMVKNDIGSLVVREGDRLIGITSFHDVANAVIKETTFQNRLLKSYIKNWPEEESAN